MHLFALDRFIGLLFFLSIDVSYKNFKYVVECIY